MLASILWSLGIAAAQSVEIHAFHGLQEATFDDAVIAGFPACQEAGRIGMICGDLVAGVHAATNEDCLVLPHSGAAYIEPMSTSTLAFDAPTYRFGGWFGLLPFRAGTRVVLRFYDQEDVLIDRVEIFPPDCAWEWFGWDLSRPAVRVVIQTTFFTGGYVSIDSLQADRAPAFFADGTCNEPNSDRFAPAVEWCDGLDNDCDGAIDEDPCPEAELEPERDARDRPKDDSESVSLLEFVSEGCGCSAAGSGSAMAWWAPLLLLGIRSRRLHRSG